MDLFDGRVRVDHFTKGAEVYFLTHYHADHMAGLRKGWDRGTLFASEDTASLLAVGKGIAEANLFRLVPGESERIEIGTGTVEVTAFEANHCPGAVMLLFESAGTRTLVTGDFRLDDAMRRILPRLKGIDTLLVDVTYDKPRYDFPTQEEVIEGIVEFVRNASRELVVVETYTVGKNKILEGLHREFGEPFFLDPHRLRLYEAIGYGGIVTGDPRATRFFACGSRYMDGPVSAVHPQWRKRASVVSATGWAVDGRVRRGTVGFPYSEHCSYPELCEFVRGVNPGCIVVTEGGRATDRVLNLP
ncbi:MAG: MBL fold metallo-hydrolase [Planctomycetota bacterium]|jgi:DNA cross-link repair 1A protein